MGIGAQKYDKKAGLARDPVHDDARPALFDDGLGETSNQARSIKATWSEKYD